MRLIYRTAMTVGSRCNDVNVRFGVDRFLSFPRHAIVMRAVHDDVVVWRVPDFEPRAVDVTRVSRSHHLFVTAEVSVSRLHGRRCEGSHAR